jgi:hypothetical protein
MMPQTGDYFFQPHQPLGCPTATNLSLTLSTTLPRTTSTTDMSDTPYNLWCLVEGEKDNRFRRVDVSSLALWEVR